MNKYLSVIFLYYRASRQRVLLALGAIPLLFVTLFLIQAGNPSVAGGYMLIEEGFGGIFVVLMLIGVMVVTLLAISNVLNDRNDLKATHTTPGYILRRMHASPVQAYVAVFVYCLIIILLMWSMAVLSLTIIGKGGLSVAGAASVDTKLALGLLRIEIGHALLPFSHPAVLVFDITVVLALAGECARSCYLTWHNGTPSAGIALIAVAMFYVWTCAPDNTFTLLAVLGVFLYGALSFGDVIFREKKPKGDPFKVNKYVGIMDMNSTEFDDALYLEVNSPLDEFDPQAEEGYLSKYGRASDNKGHMKKWNLFWLRRRFMPLGSNLEKANTFFGVCIGIGMAEHLLFFGKYQLQMKAIESSMKGATIDSGMKMPYFWDLEAHTYYGYLLAIILVLVMQMYWNYAYYNKETKSIYVMKRLPNRKEYPRTIWVSPVIQAVIIVLIMIGHTCVDLFLYSTTPDLALHSDYLSHILPF